MIGSTAEDIDGVPKNRGPAKEDWKTEAELRGQMKDIAKAKLTVAEAATVTALMGEMKILRDMVDEMSNQHNELINLYSTMRGEFDQYRKQRAIELQSWLAKGGSTSPEDN